MSSAAFPKDSLNKWLPVSLFLFVFGAIVLATLYFSPSWGLMDDFGLLKMAREFKANPAHYQEVTDNFITSGMLRPFYYSWAAVFYGVFENHPAAFYVFVAAWNMLAMIFWGIAFYHLFGVRKEDRFWTVFFYPLSFFVFTAYWNIFNYLSLQEKFVVFFAPLAMYFFQKLYQEFDKRDLFWLCLCMGLGLMSKATFVYVPFAFLVYALLDVTIVRYKPKTSWIFLVLNGFIFGLYAVFTLTFQIHGNYTSKYKDGLDAHNFIQKIVQLSAVMKILIIIGVIGMAGILFYAVAGKRKERSLGVLIYLSLLAYIGLLIPWGSQSYLVSAIGPLALGALFPLYAWLNARGGVIKFLLNSLVIIVIGVIFVGNILPNISRMGDIGRAIAFVSRQDASSDNIYFMPPPYVESADATRKFTGKNIFYCGDGKISRDLLSPNGSSYVIFVDLFPSIILQGVEVGPLVFKNGTWQIFELRPGIPGTEQTFRVPFEKTFVQQLKSKIREL